MNFDDKELNINNTNTESFDHVFLQIESILTDLRPYITSHGGDVSLVKVENGIVFIKFAGTCVSCPLSFYTVTYGIERHIKDKIPEIIRVEVIEEL
ncbi:NifU family protein [Candidatus Dependentiae bacterium]|nr:NifU family protein [Candidatus Dependentiae bacterium]